MGTLNWFIWKLICICCFCYIPSYGQDNDIVGAYRNCSMACKTIQLNPDHIFILQLDGDLYNDERYSGTWEWIDKNKVHLYIPEDNTAPNVIEQYDPNITNYCVEIFDAVGALLPGVRVVPFGRQNDKIFETNEAGRVFIPKCNEFEIEFLSYRGRYRPKGVKNNKFVITITVSQMLHLAIDETWMIEDEHLYRVDTDGSIHRDWSLKKMSKKEERKIFPK